MLSKEKRKRDLIDVENILYYSPQWLIIASQMYCPNFFVAANHKVSDKELGSAIVCLYDHFVRGANESYQSLAKDTSLSSLFSRIFDSTSSNHDRKQFFNNLFSEDTIKDLLKDPSKRKCFYGPNNIADKDGAMTLLKEVMSSNELNDGSGNVEGSDYFIFVVGSNETTMRSNEGFRATMLTMIIIECIKQSLCEFKEYEEYKECIQQIARVARN